MQFSDSQKTKINKAAQKIIKVSGNQPKGNVLEICLVLDCSLDKDYLNSTALDILTSLRRIGSPFLNMRINLIKWRSDEDFSTLVTSYPEIKLGICVDDKDQYLEPDDIIPEGDTPTDMITEDLEAEAADSEAEASENITEENSENENTEEKSVKHIDHEKTWDSLFLKLNADYNRSKLIIVLTKKERELINPSEIKDTVTTVFPKKLLLILPNGTCKTPFKFPKDTDIETMLENPEDNDNDAYEVSYEDLAPDSSDL